MISDSLLGRSGVIVDAQADTHLVEKDFGRFADNGQGASMKDDNFKIHKSWQSWLDSWCELRIERNSSGERGIVCSPCFEQRMVVQFGRAGLSLTATAQPYFGRNVTRVKEHFKSGAHKEALLRIERCSMWNDLGFMNPTESASLKKILPLFRIAYHNLRVNQPASHFEHNCTTADDLQAQNISIHYRNDDFFRDAATFISQVLLDELLVELRSASGVSIELDESTDRASEQQLVFSVRYLHNGILKTTYVGMRQICENATGEYLSDLALESIQKLVPLHKVFGIGADGAASLTGCKTGALKRIEEHVTQATETFIEGRRNDSVQQKAHQMFKAHCQAHKLNLAVQDAYQKRKVSNIVDDVLSKAANRARNSPKCRRMFLQLLQQYDAENDDFLSNGLPLRFVATRWLSRSACLDRIALDNYAVLLNCIASLIEGEKDRKQRKTLQKELDFLAKPEIIVCVFLAQFVLKPLADMSRVLQKEKVLPMTVLDGKKLCLKRLQQIEEDLSARPRKFEPFVHLLNRVTCEDSPFYPNVTLAHFEKEAVEIDEVLQDMLIFVQKLQHKIEKRFEAVDNAACIVWGKILDVTAYSTIVREDIEKAADYAGLSRLDTVAQFDVVQEIASNQLRVEHLSTATFNDEKKIAVLSVVIRQLPAIYKDAHFLLSFGITLSWTSVSCERVFSRRSSIKSILRTSMGDGLLDAYLMAMFNGPSMEPKHRKQREWTCAKAALKWLRAKDRRFV